MLEMLRRAAALGMDRLVGGGWSPSLTAIGLAPTWRWVWTGNGRDLVFIDPVVKCSDCGEVIGDLRDRGASAFAMGWNHAPKCNGLRKEAR